MNTTVDVVESWRSRFSVPQFQNVVFNFLGSRVCNPLSLPVILNPHFSRARMEAVLSLAARATRSTAAAIAPVGADVTLLETDITPSEDEITLVGGWHHAPEG